MRTRVLRTVVLPTCLALGLAGTLSVAAAASNPAPTAAPDSISDSRGVPRVKCNWEGVIVFDPPLTQEKQRITAELKEETGKVTNCRSKSGAPEEFTGGTLTGKATADASCTSSAEDVKVNGNITWNDDQGVSEYAVDTDATVYDDESSGNGVGRINDGPLAGSEIRGGAMSALSAIFDCFDQGIEIAELAITNGDLAIILKAEG